MPLCRWFAMLLPAPKSARPTLAKSFASRSSALSSSFFPGTDGLLHISEISEHRIRDVRDELKLGDQVLVKVLSIEGNKVRLSRKALIREAREKQQKAAAGGAGNPVSSSAEGGSGDSGSHE